ncbi:glucan 1,4-alpha-glucosidase [Aquisalinus flavus]|uniref:Glucoamylase n=1 Tax=Aquisalinus flavus TaxID=1526572 RepID=A0A8J2Y326_9PROT|nr:glucan 1,4-alpha-glucosidase [Aquisalinus flavus]MBD0427072.1 glucan 1,4-alpha-glucosidase [Aquisalinus flavus]UNE46897.1 glucan 1,4-alpha-glucosidase [Aquisalinus flavus]GGC98157.1 glucoamylase [Aquisalinus flavus]
MKTTLLAVSLIALVAACSAEEGSDGAASDAVDRNAASVAPGAPGRASVWAYSGKTGIGTSYEAYTDGAYSDGGETGAISKVWFSLAEGIITETMAGLIHEAQLKDMKFAIAGEGADGGYVDIEGADTDFDISYLHTDAEGRPLSLAYRVVTRDRDGKFEIEKHIFTDPGRDTLFVRAVVRALDGAVTPYLLVNPHVSNTGDDDMAAVTADALQAWDDKGAVSVLTGGAFAATSAGFVGSSAGETQLAETGALEPYQSTGDTPGNVALAAAFDPVSGEAVYDLAVGFGADREASMAAAEATLADGYDTILARYNGEGDAVGWEDYIASLDALPRLATMARDGGDLAYASALVLKAQEDKTHAGALIASLSNPWGDTTPAATSSTGYKAVWPRDFYQVAMAFLAMGDPETAKVAFDYFDQIQVDDEMEGNTGAGGWFLQKTHVNGTREWVSVQLDQTAMPVMLGWKLWQAGVIADDQLAGYYDGMLKPAADFLVDGGTVGLDWNNETITPPATQQERWEEQAGYSPSTTAAIITGLVAAADMAEALERPQDAQRYLAAADAYEASIEETMFTTNGAWNEGEADGRYFIRITRNDNPNDKAATGGANGQEGVAEDLMVDGGFLELVRYGVRSADAPSIVDSLPELDDQTRDDHYRVRYDFTFEGEPGTYPGWRRYGNDGYGETVTGINYGEGGQMRAGQRGRVWPFFTGERGHYELAAGAATDEIRATYVRGMELFANEGLMLPEQVWDGVGDRTRHDYVMGEGTDSATPLAWTHAEYIKLLRSAADQAVWDRYDIVADRYRTEE